MKELIRLHIQCDIVHFDWKRVRELHNHFGLAANPQVCRGMDLKLRGFGRNVDFLVEHLGMAMDCQEDVESKVDLCVCVCVGSWSALLVAGTLKHQILKVGPP